MVKQLCFVQQTECKSQVDPLKTTNLDACGCLICSSAAKQDDFWSAYAAEHVMQVQFSRAPMQLFSHAVAVLCSMSCHLLHVSARGSRGVSMVLH